MIFVILKRISMFLIQLNHFFEFWPHPEFYKLVANDREINVTMFKSYFTGGRIDNLFFNNYFVRAYEGFISLRFTWLFSCEAHVNLYIM